MGAPSPVVRTGAAVEAVSLDPARPTSDEHLEPLVTDVPATPEALVAPSMDWSSLTLGQKLMVGGVGLAGVGVLIKMLPELSVSSLAAQGVGLLKMPALTLGGEVAADFFIGAGASLTGAGLVLSAAARKPVPATTSEAENDEPAGAESADVVLPQTSEEARQESLQLWEKAMDALCRAIDALTLVKNLPGADPGAIEGWEQSVQAARDEVNRIARKWETSSTR